MQRLINNIIKSIKKIWENRGFILVSIIIFSLIYIISLAYKDYENKQEEINTNIIEINKKIESLENKQTTNYFLVLPDETQQPLEGMLNSDDIPLSKEIKQHIQKECSKKDIEVNLTLAIMYTESKFDIYAESYTDDYGLMGINTINLPKEEALDPFKNIDKGTDILYDLKLKYTNLNTILMAYNQGETGALRSINNGVTETNYCKKVIKKYNEYNNK